MQKFSRRSFMSQSLAAGAALSTLGATKLASANERVNIAAVGVGGMGRSNIRALLHAGHDIVALCDVDTDYAAKVFDGLPDAKVYTDYRAMLEKQKDIDGVLIATPDHTHAVIAKAAMEAGKHVYCQKPLTHDVFEARRLAQIAKETGVVTQMGIQGHSAEGARQVVEWIQGGVIGEVKTVEAWCSLSYYPWGHASWSSPVGKRPTETPAIPDTLDWDLWLGPAKERPYHRCYHPRTWRAWLDFGCGMMGDRGAHTFDPICWALDLGHPESIEASSMGGDDEIHPLASKVRYVFPKKGARPAVTINWYEGLTPTRPADLDPDEVIGHPEGGALFIGSKGYISCGVYGDNPKLHPEKAMAGTKVPEPSIERVEGSHESNWTDVIRKGGRAGADFDYSGPLTEIVLLGNIAKQINKRLYWDGEEMEFTNDEAATKLVRGHYRESWSI